MQHSNSREKALAEFKTAVRAHYKEYGRNFPWRTAITPYRVLVSEVMLQQTQVNRAIPKFKEFIKTFPSFSALARAPQAEVLSVWNGLGYNRRALFLHKTAKIISEDFNGRLPKDAQTLCKLPGIGAYTAGAIRAFAYNAESIFIETNIRSAYLHFFFKDAKGVDDKNLLPLIEKTLGRKNPRAWYFALMDYGAWVKKEYGNPNVRSRQYAKQGVFKDSRREARGAIVRELVSGKKNKEKLLTEISAMHAGEALRDLIKEGFVKQKGGCVSLT